MADKKYAPIDIVDNSSSDKLNPNGTRLSGGRLNYIQTQYLKVTGVQVLDQLPAIPIDGENLAILSTDGRLYLFIGGVWRRIALED